MKVPLVFANIFTSKSINVKTFDAASAFIWYLYVAFAGVIACDVLIAGSLCWTLTKYRTSFKNSLLAALNSRNSLWEKCFGGAMTLGKDGPGFRRRAGHRSDTQTNEVDQQHLMNF
ncbi:hypothetical protein H0H92_002778 [Tricholoma furcatifolium]|nr:hypothetical protein H0H92_002778 [Tricholoma furcatifolium]